MHTVLSRPRVKMRCFGGEISSILEAGYCLLALSARRRHSA